MDHNDRYIYYFPVGHPKDREDAPIIQYDVKTGKRKVICWLRDYYFDKYGYWVNGTYGLAITKDGSTIVACMNGSFQGYEVSGYGHPSLFVINIPEEERPDD